MKISKLAIVGIASLLGCGLASADDLQMGGHYNTFVIDENGSPVTEGGGSVTVSYLNGQQLALIYCVGLYTNISVPADYPKTVVTFNGVVDGAAVHNAGEIAWLVDNFGVQAESNALYQEALQAAIWSVEYNSTSLGYAVATGDSGQAYYSKYQSDLAALGNQTASLSSVDWFSPTDASGRQYQGQVGIVAGSPEPGSVFLLGTVGAAALWLASRKRSAAVKA